MRERIAKIVGNAIEKKLILGTFHSVCRRYLVTYGHLIGLKKDFGIADSSDTISIIKRIMKRLGISIDPRKAQSRISSSKSRGVSHAQIAQEQAKRKNVEQQDFEMVFEAYEDQLARSNLLDYDDLLLRCVDLLRQHPTCVSNVEVVLIDEFQDTNVVQFDLMRLFAAQKKRVTTVGDPDQSIYGWRSAEIKNLARMQKQYPDTLVIHLKDNYRSSGAILLAAHEVIEQDESRPSKPLLPTHCPGTVPVLRCLPSPEVEALWIVSEIQRTIALTGNVLELSDFAVLLRSASLSRHIESAMGKTGIPYRMVGGQRFFDRIEIRILLDYLRVISQPHNNDALSRIVNIPARGIGLTTAKGLLEDAEARRVSLWKSLRVVVQGPQSSKTRISKVAQSGLGSFIGIILTLRKKVQGSAECCSPEKLLRHLIHRLDFKAYLERTYSDDHETRWANVEELIAQASEYSDLSGERSAEEAKEVEDDLPQIEGLAQQRSTAGEEALSKFLANVALATELQREDESTDDKPQSQITISTIHAAKGLEWPVVFVPSAYEGCIPHSRAEDTDEERRLLYVAMTRAQTLLYISCPTKNTQRTDTTLSPFLSTKKVGQYLVNKGPEINSGTVNDVCRILNRECPTELQIIETCRILRSREDDLWPLNGAEDVKAIGARWSNWDDHILDEPAAKRKRLKDHERDDGRDRYNVMHSVNAPLLSAVGTLTTMQNSSTFSCRGFSSATSQLFQNNQHREAEARRKATSILTIADDSKSGGSQVAQTSLTNFWAKDRQGDEYTKPARSKPFKRDTEGDLVADGSRSTSLASYQSAPPPSTPSMEMPLEQQDSKPRVPLASIPQPLSAHRLPNVSKMGRPCHKSIINEPTIEHYIFLSSSPPRDDTPMQEKKGGSTPIQDGQSLEYIGAQPKTSDMKPASTLHTTSVNLLQADIKAPRRTLGVRRSMNGWAARTNQRVSVPRMERAKQ